MAERECLSDESAHREPENVELREGERVDKAQGMSRHRINRVRRLTAGISNAGIVLSRETQNQTFESHAASTGDPRTRVRPTFSHQAPMATERELPA